MFSLEDINRRNLHATIRANLTPSEWERVVEQCEHAGVGIRGRFRPLRVEIDFTDTHILYTMRTDSGVDILTDSYDLEDRTTTTFAGRFISKIRSTFTEVIAGA